MARLLCERGARTVVTPPGLPDAWLPGANVKRIADGAAQFPAALDRVDSVVTAPAVTVAETGTIDSTAARTSVPGGRIDDVAVIPVGDGELADGAQQSGTAVVAGQGQFNRGVASAPGRE
ncbi:hypothetical protein [Streptomyces sp. NPDC056453]|uniref:hypothetical protein n=1 Tax=Streptomyces sp. NPDC056453 TaxID=3345822 RepID=UPI0036AA8126